ncbi:MAG: Uncharacterized protein G01um1014107_268 [Parcubacteria group bacterium Gr01-1014_107]|nr:MAG: Uncharacterized protein G01um1014107_268 [Parcubacteria group bacterium Gr01-1014_107]
MDKDYITSVELAKLLKVSHVTVYKKIKRGTIKAIKLGRNFIIYKKELPIILGKELTGDLVHQVEEAVKKAVQDYGEALKMLGKE